MIGANLITLTQLEKTGSTGRVLIPLEISKSNSTFETRSRSRFSTFVFGEGYLRHFQQMNFFRRINMYECTSLVIRDF